MHSGICAHLPWVAGVLLALTQATNANEMTPADAAPAEPVTYRLAADTEIHLRLLEPVASNTHKHGERFALESAEPVLVDGVVIIPAGAKGEGEVVHAAKAGFGGRAGELILVARFLRVGDQTVKLRSFSASNGRDRVNLAMGLSFVVVGIFVNGKDIALPAGTDVFAKIATDHLLPGTLATGPDAAPSDIPDQPATEIDNNEVSQR